MDHYDRDTITKATEALREQALAELPELVWAIERLKSLDTEGDFDHPQYDAIHRAYGDRTAIRRKIRECLDDLKRRPVIKAETVAEHTNGKSPGWGAEALGKQTGLTRPKRKHKPRSRVPCRM